MKTARLDHPWINPFSPVSGPATGSFNGLHTIS